MKGQISIQTIVGLIIALTVLIAVILFFTGKFADLSGDIDKIQPDTLANSAECKLACDLAKSTDDPMLWESKKESCNAINYTCNEMYE